jgi:nucleotidyltransferase substrate binding protein (TIGR01987 family)
LNALSEDCNLKKNILTHAIVMFDENSERLKIAFEKLSNALQSLDVAIKEKPRKNRIHVDATIQRFEFTIELFWLLLREIIRSKGIGNVSFPKDVLIAAFSNQLIENEQTWLTMLNDRNKTSHTYDKTLADEIYSRVKAYHPIMKKTFDSLLLKFHPKP